MVFQQCEHGNIIGICNLCPTQDDKAPEWEYHEHATVGGGHRHTHRQGGSPHQHYDPDDANYIDPDNQPSPSPSPPPAEATGEVTDLDMALQDAGRVMPFTEYTELIRQVRGLQTQLTQERQQREAAERERVDLLMQVERMNTAAEEIPGDDGFVQGYKIKTGAFHQLLGAARKEAGILPVVAQLTAAEAALRTANARAEATERERDYWYKRLRIANARIAELEPRAALAEEAAAIWRVWEFPDKVDDGAMDRWLATYDTLPPTQEAG